MLTLLLIGMFALAFNVSPITAKTGVDDLELKAKRNSEVFSSESPRWNFDEIDKWSDFAIVGDDSVEVIVGVYDDKPFSYGGLMGLIARYGGELDDTVSMGDRLRAVVIDVPLGTVSSFVADIRSRGFSRYVEPNMRFQISEVPNDPSWSAQWGPTKIEADYAWNTTIGDSSVVVAVLDTGVDWDHPDLAANIWNNTGEVVDGIDNDGNGFVDDIRGWDFVDTTTSVATGEDGIVRDNDPMDRHGHGTHCSGIVAAVTNNSLGIAGVCWNCKIMPVRMSFKTPSGGGSVEADDASKAIIYAADNGADIISMSWSFPSSSYLLHDAITYAYDSDVLLVAAAGNEDSSLKRYPAAYDEVIAVTGTDSNDDSYSETTFGYWVELAAPGVNIYSTVNDDSYAYMTGTSMSAPHVAGVAALVLSVCGRADMVRQILRETADDLGDPGFDNYYGYGRINAQQAVEFPDHDLVVTLETPYCSETGGSSLLNATVRNFGLNSEVDAELQLLVNDTIVDSTTIPELLTGESYAINYLWTPTVEGWYNVTAYAPPVSGEISTENNVEAASVLVDVLNILIVNDDDGGGLISGTSLPQFESALTDADYDYVVWNESSKGDPRLHFLTQFELVIWTCGDYWNGAVDPSDATILEYYLAQGGNLLLEGASIAYDHGDDDFMVNVAHAINQTEIEAGGLTVTDPDHPVTSGLPTSFTWSTDPPFVDNVSPTNEGAEVIQYTGTSGTAVTVFDGVNGRSVVYCAFPLYFLKPQERQILIINSVEWLLTPPAFDFGTSGSPVESEYTQVTETTFYSASLGYGWSSTTGLTSRDRGAPDNNLKRDLVQSQTQNTFNVDLANDDYQVNVTIGDQSYGHDLIDVTAEGILKIDDLTVSAGSFQEIIFWVTVADEQLNLGIHDDGGGDGNWVLTALTIELGTPPTPPTEASIDFGTSGSPVESEYTQVTETTFYSASLGYGWSSTTGLTSRDRGAPDNNLKRDLVQSQTQNTFNVDLANDVYTVIVIMGDQYYTHDLIDIYVEDTLRVNDQTTAAGIFVTTTFFTVTVTDGQLNLRIQDDGGTDPNWVINSLTVEPASPPP